MSQISIKIGDDKGFYTVILMSKFTYLSRENKLSIQGEKLSLDVVSQILNIFSSDLLRPKESFAFIEFPLERHEKKSLTYQSYFLDILKTKTPFQ